MRSVKIHLSSGLELGDQQVARHTARQRFVVLVLLSEVNDEMFWSVLVFAEDDTVPDGLTRDEKLLLEQFNRPQLSFTQREVIHRAPLSTPI